MKEKTKEKDEFNLITLAQEYADEDKARGLLESLLWPDGAVCRIARTTRKSPFISGIARGQQTNAKAYINAGLAESHSQ